MDRRTGEIFSKKEDIQKIPVQYRRAVESDKLSKGQLRDIEKYGRTKVHRNDSCPCGSGKKFKRCCWLDT